MIKLNLGCGFDYRQDFINVDIRFDAKPDVVCSLDVMPFPDNHADYIVAQDILEHFSKAELMKVIPEIQRVLKQGGTLEVRCPDCERIIDKYANGEYDIHRTLQYIFGGQDYAENVHKMGFTKATLRELLEFYGFKITDIQDADEWSNMICWATK